jgi:hypothetical protein
MIWYHADLAAESAQITLDVGLSTDSMKSLKKSAFIFTMSGADKK